MSVHTIRHVISGEETLQVEKKIDSIEARNRYTRKQYIRGIFTERKNKLAGEIVILFALSEIRYKRVRHKRGALYD